MANVEEETREASDNVEGIVNEQIAPEMENCISFLEKGTMLTKVRSARRRYQRYFYVDTSSLMLRCQDSKKCLRRVPFQIAIKHIAEIREDDRSPKQRNKNTASFTVVVGDRMQRLKLVAPTPDVRNTWVRGLRFLVSERSVEDPVKQEQMWLEECFAKADKKRNGLLDKDEIVSMLNSLNVSSEIATYIKERAAGQQLDMNEFVALYKEVSGRQELRDLFSTYSSNKVSMKITELSEFFKREQNQELTEDELQDIVGRSEQCPKLKDKNLLSYVGFKIMFSLPELNVKQMRCRTVYQDMTQPLNHYFINSSHNTYLEGNQIYGNSSVYQYSRVLTHRCRCVELDVWDGDDDEPVIYHGYTLTTKILFKDALKAIEKRAFKKSVYPVILSIQNRCSLKQQVRMAELLKEVFEDKLLLEPLPEDSTALPSPEQLKGRVIVKGKKLPAIAGEPEESDTDEAAEIEDEEVQERVKKFEKMREKLTPELSACVVICQAVHFKSFEESARMGKFEKMSSFNEGKALKLMEDDGGQQYVQYNARQMSRTYPAGTRIDSSNYDPFPMWTAGCQVVLMAFIQLDIALYSLFCAQHNIFKNSERLTLIVGEQT